MKKLFVYLIFFIIFSQVTSLFGKELVPRALLSLLKSRSTDQIMMALEPWMKMEEEEFNKIWLVNSGANYNYFVLHVSASYKEKANPNEKFHASYFTPIAFIPLFVTPYCYLQSMYNIEGKGPTPHAALVDMVVQLVENKIIDSKWLLKKLTHF